MKKFLSTKGILAGLLLLVALGSGTALAGSQAAVAPQEALTRTDGATIVTSSLCTANNSEFTVWGSGWGSEEIILLSVVRDANNSTIWFSGIVNEAGAFELTFNLVTKVPSATSAQVKYPGEGLFSLEAVGMKRLATTPIVVVAEKCPS